MNKTLWQIRDSIMEALHSYEITDDRVIEPELVEDKIIDLRSTLIKEEALSGPIDQGYYQIIENLEVLYNDNSIRISPSITIRQTKKIGTVDLPGLNTRIGQKAILYFGLPDLSYNFDYKTLLGVISNNSAQFTKDRYVFTVVGTQALVRNYGLEGKRYVTVIAILEDPRKAPGYVFETSDFPVSDPQKLELLVIKHFMSTMGFGPDKLNDANINIQPQR